MNRKKSILSEKGANVLSVKAEQALWDMVPVDQKTAQRVLKLLEPKNLKRIAAGAAAGSILISVGSSLAHDRIYRATVSREMKKQLEPLKKKVDMLTEQNKAILQENEELREQLRKIEKKL